METVVYCASCLRRYGIAPGSTGLHPWTCECGATIVPPHHEEKLTDKPEARWSKGWSGPGADDVPPTLPPPPKVTGHFTEEQEMRLKGYVPEERLAEAHDEYARLSRIQECTEAESRELREKSARNLEDLYTREQYEAVCKERDRYKAEVEQQAATRSLLEGFLRHAQDSRDAFKRSLDTLELWARRHGWQGR